MEEQDTDRTTPISEDQIPAQLLSEYNESGPSQPFPLQQPTPVHISTHPRAGKASSSMAHARQRRSTASIKTGPTMALNILPSAPASPPTPAPSPTPYQRPPTWTSAEDHEFGFLRDARGHFSNLSQEGKQRYLAEILNMCDSQLLSFVSGFVSPRLKKDPFEHLPDELCLRVSCVPVVNNISKTDKYLGSFLRRRTQSSRQILASLSTMAQTTD